MDGIEQPNPTIGPLRYDHLKDIAHGMTVFGGLLGGYGAGYLHGVNKMYWSFGVKADPGWGHEVAVPTWVFVIGTAGALLLALGSIWEMQSDG